jgi:AcrR family transcriptional regulator
MKFIKEKQIQQDLRQREFLAAAKFVFLTKGFKTATVKDIANRTNQSPAMLYRYFESKEELYARLLIDALEKLGDDIIDVLSVPVFTEKKIDKLCDAFVTLYEEDPKILTHLFYFQAGDILERLSGDALQQFKTAAERIHGTLTDMFVEGIDQKIFIDENPSSLADILWATYSGLVLWLDSKRSLESKKKYVKSTLDSGFQLICRGMAKNMVETPS